ncbi:MAG: DUF4011 domain-containing protein [Planctomycetota bacterium]
MYAPIPERRASRYADSQHDNRDVVALVQLFQSGLRAALESQVRETAHQQFDVAVECFHQLEGLGLSEDQRGILRDAMQELAARFPTAWRANTALGLCERAGEAARVETRRELLVEALAVLQSGRAATDPERELLDVVELDALAAQVQGHIAALDAGSGAPGQGAAALVEAARPPTGDRQAEALAGLADDLAAEPPSASPEDAAANLAVELEALPRVHLAALGLGARLLQALRITHTGGARVEGAMLELTSEPPLIAPCAVPLGALGRGALVELNEGRLAALGAADPLVLRRLTERAEGGVTALVRRRDGAEVGRAFAPWTLLPAAVWPGASIAPESLAAFVLPNDPALAAVMQRAARHLDAATGSPALDGYQSNDPSRVVRIAAALHEALREAELTYAEPPASFEVDGQRVRFPSEALGTRLATCLDVALLSAALLEQAGLHALVILVEGHALAGVWLTPETFDVAVIDDAARLAKRVALPEVVVFDPTVVTARPSVDFDGARALAEARLADRAGFRFALDVQRARRGGARPLPTLVDRATDTAHGADAEGVPQRDGDGPRPKRDLDAELAAYLAARSRADEVTEAPATRLDRWQRHLLDLSMRNRLLNATGRSKRVIPLLVAEPALVEDRLAQGKGLRIEPRPPELELDPPSDGSAPSQRERMERIAPLLAAAQSAGALKSSLGAEELEARLVALYREARTAVEEGGANSLYVALGFLTFREKGKAHSQRRAPLLLVPVELKRASVRRGYALAPTGEDTRINVTLLEYLRRDHQVDIQGLDPLPTDDAGVDVALVLRIVQDAVKDEAGWEVQPDAELGLYSFAKYLLWRDLRDRIDSLRENPLVAHLVDRPREPFPEPMEAPAAAELDARFSAADVLAPLSYDSSQLSAILAAAAGRTFVLEGPPGTGKSQTIANLIAHMVAHGKSVLFVSEKMAALDVVQRRLQALGLGTACLELHSNKASKKGVLEQLKAALDEGRVRGARRRPWETLAQESDAVRAEVNGHVAALHEQRQTGESVHAALGRTIAIQDEVRATAGAGGAGTDSERAPLELAEFGIDDPTEVAAETLAGWRALCDELDVEARVTAVGPEHPLLLVGRTEYSPLLEDSTRAALRAFDAPAAEFAVAANELCAALSLDAEGPAAPTTATGWDALAALAQAVASLPPCGPALATCIEDSNALSAVERALARLGELGALNRALHGSFRVSPATLDLGALEALRREMDGGGWFVRWRRKGALLKALRGIAREPRALQLDGALNALDLAARRATLAPEVEQADAVAAPLLGEAWGRARAEQSGLEQQGSSGGRGEAALEAAKGQLAAVQRVAAAARGLAAATGVEVGVVAKGTARVAVDVAPLRRTAAHAAFERGRAALRRAPGLRDAAAPHAGTPVATLPTSRSRPSRRCSAWRCNGGTAGRSCAGGRVTRRRARAQREAASRASSRRWSAASCVPAARARRSRRSLQSASRCTRSRATNACARSTGARTSGRSSASWRSTMSACSRPARRCVSARPQRARERSTPPRLAAGRRSACCSAS